ncbi:hypothetical protein [Salmonella enterica]|uniref:hypothetical protein n=1 Tax=Salmonella enterica TaxID=28901 RepID=UPI00398C440E
MKEWTLPVSVKQHERDYHRGSIVLPVPLTEATPAYAEDDESAPSQAGWLCAKGRPVRWGN